MHKYRISAKFSAASLLLAAAFNISGCVVGQVATGDIYKPQPGQLLTQEKVDALAPGFSLEQQKIVTADGTEINGVLLRRPHAQRTVLYFGGNMFVVENGDKVAKALFPFDVNIMMIDYRGYGTSRGEAPTLDLMKSDGLAVFDHLVSTVGIEPSSIIVHGHSMGSFLAGYVGANRQTGGVVLQSSFTTTEEFARKVTPGLIRPFVRFRIAPDLQGLGNLKLVPEIKGSLLVIVGQKDKSTAPSMSKTLYTASPLSPECKSLVIVNSAGHNDIFNYPSANEAYASFLHKRDC